MKAGFKKKPEIKSGKKLAPGKKPARIKQPGKEPEAAPAPAPGPGRPRSETVQMPIFDTLQQCAAATGVPLGALKMAKSSGSEAFRHGRVNFGEFIRWFFAQGTDDDNIDWVKENKRLDALIKRIRLDELKKRVIDFAEVNRFLQQLVGGCFFAELERMSQEFPPVLKGRDETEIQTRILADVEKVKADLAARLKSWSPK
jgi:hypothetical protein